MRAARATSYAMNQLASIPEEPSHQDREKLLVLVDLDCSSVLGNDTDGILSALDLPHALHTQDTVLMQMIAMTMLNPRMIAAMHALDRQYRIMVAVYTAKAPIAKTRIQEGVPVLDDGKTVASHSTADLSDINYLRSQASAASRMSEQLQHVGLITSAIARNLGLSYAPSVFITHGTKSPQLVKTHMGFPDVRAVLFDDQATHHARQLLPDTGLSEGQRAVMTGILPVRPFDIAQWEIPAARVLAATLNGHRIRPRTPRALADMFMKFFTDKNGTWDFVRNPLSAILSAREASPNTWQRDKEDPWQTPSVRLIGI